MELIVYIFLLIYVLVAAGVALGITPNKFFTNPIERFIVRVSVGLVWPFYFGYQLAVRFDE